MVATPGRLLDHILNEAIATDAIEHVVLDEADQMLDMGFREELEAIVETLPESRRSHLVSATFPRGVVELARSGGEGLARRKTFAPSAMRELEANRGVRAPAVRPAPNSAEKPVDAEPAAALIVAFAAAVAAATLGVSRIALVGL